MATLKIEPIETKTIRGYDAQISGIVIGSSDCIKGTVWISDENRHVAWDENGICRDQDSGCNLDTKTPEFEEIQEAVILIFDKDKVADTFK